MCNRALHGYGSVQVVMDIRIHGSVIDIQTKFSTDTDRVWIQIFEKLSSYGSDTDTDPTVTVRIQILTSTFFIWFRKTACQFFLLIKWIVLSF